MDSNELINDYRAQIEVCEKMIQQNLGVIQYCKGKIAQLEKKEADNIPAPTGEIQP